MTKSNLYSNTFAFADCFQPEANAVLYPGDCLRLLKQIPDRSIQLIVTSPPYNIGKEYEKKRQLQDYIQLQEQVIRECVRVLSDTGSICWEVGNYVDNGSIIPLDIALYPIFNSLDLVMRNRIIWSFEHGLHCSNRFSGRYETILWFTRNTNNTNKYVFNLDPVRVPQKYPGKRYFKGPKAGQYSCNPLIKNDRFHAWQCPPTMFRQTLSLLAAPLGFLQSNQHLVSRQKHYFPGKPHSPLATRQLQQCAYFTVAFDHADDRNPIRQRVITPQLHPAIDIDKHEYLPPARIDGLRNRRSLLSSHSSLRLLNIFSSCMNFTRRLCLAPLAAKQ